MVGALCGAVRWLLCVKVICDCGVWMLGVVWW